MKAHFTFYKIQTAKQEANSEIWENLIKSYAQSFKNVGTHTYIYECLRMKFSPEIF